MFAALEATVPIEATAAAVAAAVVHSGGTIEATVPIDQRSVGVVSRTDALVQDGYTVVSAGCETYLIDNDGRMVHCWRSERKVFVSHLLPNGHLIRDGSDNDVAPMFRAGGAAGWVEEVTWDNEVVWSFSRLPYDTYLSHHDLEPMPNGNLLVSLWKRKTKEETVAAGRKSELVPDGEVWDQVLIELAPDGKGSANIVWEWSLFDHLVQDADPSKANYGMVADHPELLDINYCPPGGKTGCRNQLWNDKDGLQKAIGTSGFGVYPGPPGATGEKDWTHANSVSYDAQRDQIIQSFNTMSEIVVIDHGTTTEQAKGHTGGRRGKGGDILFRWGNAQVFRGASRKAQILFNQHSAKFTPEGTVIIFNNGRVPDRHWSSVEEIALPEAVPGSGDYELQCGKVFGRELIKWSHGPRLGRLGSFFCTHISGCRRLANGNTLVIMGPQGIVFEVNTAGEEVWRWVSPLLGEEHAVSVSRQGGERIGGRFSLFGAMKYAKSYPAFDGRDLAPRRYLEAYA